MNGSMKTYRRLIPLFALAALALAPAHAEDELLRAEEAFTYAVSEDGGELVVERRAV